MDKEVPAGSDPITRAAALLGTAQAAAAAKDAIGMVEALHASGYLAGLKRMLQNKWSGIPRADVDDTVAEAVEEAYVAVSNRRRVGNLGAWLWKAANNIAKDRWDRDHAVMQQVDEASQRAGDLELHPDERRAVDALADHRRAEAVRLARQLLSAVGHGQVRDVMDMVIDTVEAGEPDLPPEFVADALGISKDAARALMSRGLDRLKSAARAQGFELPEEIPSDVSPDNETEEESD